MKPQNIILSVIILLILVFSACREVKVTTKINRDGTFTRIITVTGDSAEVLSKGLPFPVDDTWQMKFSKDTMDTTKWAATYSKTFRNSMALNEEIKSDTSFYRNLEREVVITKKFGFFYNYLTFRETYKSVNPFKALDYKDFLTEEDLQWYGGIRLPVTSADSTLRDKIEEKVDDFLVKSVIAEIDSILKDGIERLQDPSLEVKDLTMYNDSLEKIINNWTLDSGAEIIMNLQKWSGNDTWSKLLDLTPPLFDNFDRKKSEVDTLAFIEAYNEVVEMPGIITATNSEMLRGNQVSWDVHIEAFFIGDLVMYAESRVINSWAFILSGVVVLALLVLLGVKAVRR
jgi:hypothetical protein